MGLEGLFSSFSLPLQDDKSLHVAYGFLSLAPDLHQMFLEVLHCWQLAAHSLRKIKPWHRSDQEFERGETSGGVGPGVVYELSHG